MRETLLKRCFDNMDNRIHLALQRKDGHRDKAVPRSLVAEKSSVLDGIICWTIEKVFES